MMMMPRKTMAHIKTDQGTHAMRRCVTGGMTRHRAQLLLRRPHTSHFYLKITLNKTEHAVHSYAAGPG